MPVARRQEEINDDMRSNVVTLDLSDRGLQRIEPLHDGVSAQTILYNHNNIARIENLQYFEHLQQLSLANNRLVEMTGILQAQGLKVLDLSNNSIISIEGLTHLRCLEWLNLSGNSIKRMQNLEKNINLHHLDVSDNSIVKVNSIKSLLKLKTLLLHGNLISSLSNIMENVPISSIVTLSLGDNEIMDLNEITNLKLLSSLEQLSIAGNPCLLSLSNVIGFNYRPFILVNCPKLRNLDGHLISQSDRLESERLRSDGHLKTFSTGRHLQLVKYLTQATPTRNYRTPTPAMDNISRDDDRWSVPVLDDKPSTHGHELTLEEITPSEFEDDQLVSESCYVPINDSQSVLSSYTGDIKDWYVADRTNHIRNTSNEPPHDGIGLPVEILDEQKNGRTREMSPAQENGSNEQEESDQPLMTEEEAFKLIHIAATIIQSRVRGFLIRRKLDFYQYRHRKRAATLIQAVWRGYRTRTYDVKVITVRNEIRTRRLMAHVTYLAGLVIKCQDQASRDKRTMAKAIKCLWSELEKQNTRYVTWLTSQQNQAAVKIQRHWRGYRVRKLFPRPSPVNTLSYPGLAVMCRDMQEQIDLLRKEVEMLKSDDSVKKIAENCDHEEPGADPRSIPAIRIIRPSVCILPELKLDSSTKEHLEKSADFESVLDDVDIEPLDIGDYEQNDQDVCNSTFDVENSAFDVESAGECGHKTDERKSEKEQTTERSSKSTTGPTHENSSCFESNSKEQNCSVADIEAQEGDDKDLSLASCCDSEQLAYNAVKDMAKTDAADTPQFGKQEPVVDISSSDSNDTIETSENKPLVQYAELEAATFESNSSKQDASCSTSPSIQGDISLSSDVSQTSDSSGSPTKFESGRKKKKLLLRSTSADQVTRLRSLHASSSFDSESLSSSLNFDSRLSQRAASLLKNLRSEIAKVTARHMSKEENFDDDFTTENDGTDSYDILKDISSSEPRDSEHAVKPNTDIQQGQSEVLSNTTYTSRQDTESSDHIRKMDEMSLVDTAPVSDKVDVFGKGVEVSFDATTAHQRANQQVCVPRDGSEVDLPKKETDASSERPCFLQENAEAFPKRDTHLVPAHDGASERENNDMTDNDKKSFTMPVFHDVEASLSFEDFIMEDSLEEHDT